MPFKHSGVEIQSGGAETKYAQASLGDTAVSVMGQPSSGVVVLVRLCGKQVLIGSLTIDELVALHCACQEWLGQHGGLVEFSPEDN